MRRISRRLVAPSISNLESPQVLRSTSTRNRHPEYSSCIPTGGIEDHVDAPLVKHEECLLLDRFWLNNIGDAHRDFPRCQELLKTKPNCRMIWKKTPIFGTEPKSGTSLLAICIVFDLFVLKRGVALATNSRLRANGSKDNTPCFTTDAPPCSSSGVGLHVPPHHPGL